MKKIIVLLMLCFLAGCNENLADSPRDQLIKSPSEWIEKYGDDRESQMTANIVLAIQVINRQGEAIKALDKRLAVLELEDPNDTMRWTDLSFIQGSEDVQLGLRSDGVLIWRPYELTIGPLDSIGPPKPNKKDVVSEGSEEILICPKHYKRYCKICESIILKAGWLLPTKGSYLYNQALKEKKEN